jgi:hypothetical protein
LWRHTSVVRTETGFDSRTDLLKERACMPMEATDPCKIGVIGSTPIRSTEDGLMVQRDDTALAWRKSGFDSRSVH